MDGLGPFEDIPRLALAVSGGADSMALAVLARDWATRRAGAVHAFVVDHGLRPESAAEAAITVSRLSAIGVPASVLTPTGLAHGPALAERARIARYRLLTEACRTGGFLSLLLGHHAGDQLETLAMRALRGSGAFGLAGMAALVDTRDVRLLRPLLAVAPEALRAFLRSQGLAWVEDPSNRDMSALRPRLRHRLQGRGRDEVTAAARVAGHARAVSETVIAVELANAVTLYPEGFACVHAHRLRPAALGALIQLVSGSDYPPSEARIAAFAAAPGPATLAGVRFAAAGTALLVLREEAAMEPPVPALPGRRWDNRMRLVSGIDLPAGAMIGALGNEAAGFRKRSHLPSVVLRTLPAVRHGDRLLAVPHLGYACEPGLADAAFRFEPAKPAAGAPFRPV